ncbi:MAG TPA: glycosyltransferase, partial [Chthoniobacterales bacterium]|nr:glycosyltransferase [Chthoniobacterales bacterium]
MRLDELDRFAQENVDLAGKRLLIFIVAYNAEATIEKVLKRIPQSLRHDGVEVLIIDDSSSDQTFARGLRYQSRNGDFKINVLRTPENQGYGGNQKLGYRYAIDNGFDIVALLHGDGKYAPEKLPALLKPVIAEQTDAVLGSRLIDKRAGMPLGKWIGNCVFTAFENAVLGTQLSDFHCGYRIYAARALAQIPFEKNTNDFHFDTEIVIQFLRKNLRIREAAIPMFYGDGIPYRDAVKYAWNIFKTTVRARLCQLSLFYDRRYDVETVEEVYDLKLGYASSHTAAIAAAKPGSRILDVGCGQGRVAREMVKKGCHVTGLDRHVPISSGRGRNMDFIRWDLDCAEFPVNVSQFDQIFL